jgi:hypothetical protein
VRADNPGLAISQAHHLPVTARAAMNSNTSEAVTSSGSFATTLKNAFRSNAVARTVFDRARPATNVK